MKVNLSYSVALDDVLSTVHKLFLEQKIVFDKKYNSLEFDFTEEKLQSLLNNIRELRGAFIEFDNGLNELSTILHGYQKIINGEHPNPAPAPKPPEAQDESEESNEE